MVFVGVAAVIGVVVLFVLMLLQIRDLQSRVDALWLRVVEQVAISSDRERSAIQAANSLAQEMAQSVTAGIKQQAEMMQQSIKVAWNPQPAETTPRVGNPAVDKIMAKYGFAGGSQGFNLPVPEGVQEHDFGKDPTDDFLMETDGAAHMGAAMLPGGDLDLAANPTGIPGFQAGW